MDAQDGQDFRNGTLRFYDPDSHPVNPVYPCEFFFESRPRGAVAIDYSGYQYGWVN